MSGSGRKHVSKWDIKGEETQHASLTNSIHHKEEANMTTEEEMEKKYMTTVDGKEYLSSENFFRWQRDYWNGVAESDGFDIEGVSGPPGMNGMLAYNCQKVGPFPGPTRREMCYAMLGLHRYNMLKDTSFQLQALLKYNMLLECLSSYYMTLVAIDPEVDPEGDLLPVIFQVRVDEKAFNSLDLMVSVARRKDEVTTKVPFVPHYQPCAVEDSFFDGELPDWPSNDAWNDTKRFYVVKISEWQASEWIYLYLELLLRANDRRSSRLYKEFFSKVRIGKVAIETNSEDVKPSKEWLKAKCANVYITFTGLETAPRTDEIGEHVERKAIVRRVISSTGSLTLVGKLWGGKDTTKHTRKHILTSGGNGQSSEKRPHPYRRS